MHHEAYQFVAAHVPPLDGLRVAEIGSYNVNGTVRPLFEGAKGYTGYDVRKGRGVDEVQDIAERLPRARYDVVVSTEALEHAADPEALVAAMGAILAPGGLLILTAAAPERTPHGNDGEAVGPKESYTPIAPDALRGWLDGAGLRVLRLEHHPRRGDVYAYALKAQKGGEA